jgi:hypothetical protein
MMIRVRNRFDRAALIRMIFRYAPEAYLPQASKVAEKWLDLEDWSKPSLIACFSTPPSGNESEALDRAADAWARQIGAKMSDTALETLKQKQKSPRAYRRSKRSL